MKSGESSFTYYYDKPNSITQEQLLKLDSITPGTSTFSAQFSYPTKGGVKRESSSLMLLVIFSLLLLSIAQIFLKGKE